MKKALITAAVLISLCSFKGGTTVDPSYLATWRCVILSSEGKAQSAIWQLRANAKTDRFDIYRKSDPEGKPYITVRMEDATHFKGKSKESNGSMTTTEHDITGYFENKKLYIHLHDERSTDGKVSEADKNYVYYKWDESVKKYTDFEDFKPMEPTR